MNKRIGIAFAGLRHNHIYTLLNKARENADTEVKGYWEEFPAAAEAAAEKFTEKRYDSYDALLADPEVDIVAVGDYYGIRGQRIIKALKAGKHVMVDKPVCTKLDELSEIEKLCTENGLKLGCMLPLRYDPSIRCASGIIASGKLGAIHSMSFTAQHPLDSVRRPGWYFEDGKHGGTFNDIAIHGLDAIKLITGMKYASTLCARSWNSMAKDHKDFPDGAQFMGMLENGAGVIADASYASPAPSGFKLPHYWRFIIWGETGYLECKYGGGSVTVALTGDAEATTIQCGPVEGDYLREFIAELRGEKTMFDTAYTIDSARTALELQAFADRK